VSPAISVGLLNRARENQSRTLWSRPWRAAFRSYGLCPTAVGAAGDPVVQSLNTVRRAFCASRDIDAHVMEETFDGDRVTTAVASGGEVTVWSRPKAGEDALRRDIPPQVAEARRASLKPPTTAKECIPGVSPPTFARARRRVKKSTSCSTS
jgi:hypothetical protein